MLVGLQQLWMQCMLSIGGRFESIENAVDIFT